MSINRRTSQRRRDDVLNDTKPGCTALVPVTPSAPRSQDAPVTFARPISTFVTQLIATAEQLPQTRPMRRATPADAKSAYTASQQPAYGLGNRARHSI